VQSEHALLGIRLTASIYPAIAFALCAVCLAFYRIDKSIELEMSRELDGATDAFLPEASPAVPQRHDHTTSSRRLCGRAARRLPHRPGPAASTAASGA
jgi:hypothetical protein